MNINLLFFIKKINKNCLCLKIFDYYSLLPPVNLLKALNVQKEIFVLIH